MRQRLTESHLRFVRTVVAGISVIGAFLVFLNFGWPLKIGTLLFVLAVAYWSVQSDLPEIKDILLVGAVAVAASLGWAALEGQKGESGSYDFIVVPRRAIASESAFPGPNHEASDSPFYRYGDHVEVKCRLVGYDDKEWLALSDGNFMRKGELAPSPLEGGVPPLCPS